MTDTSQQSSSKKTFVIDDAGTMPQAKSGQSSGYNELHIRSKTGGQTFSFASANEDALDVIRQLTDGNTNWQIDTSAQMDKQSGQQTN
jgi:hypothetical protein